MSTSENHSKASQEVNKDDTDDTVLAQIGEDPGLPADTIEQDSKAMDRKQNKQGTDTNSVKAEE